MPNSAPPLDQIDLDVVVRLRTAVARLNRRLRYESLGGISPAQSSLLAIASRLESPTLGELAKAEQIQPPTVTRLVATMEEAGLVERSIDPSDRRITRVSVTKKGHEELARIRSLKTAFLADRVAAMSPDEREALTKTVELLEWLGTP